MTGQEFKKIEQKIPDLPGVYFFLGPKNKILYIGKATSLRNRVKSYFNADLIVTRGALVQQMVGDAVKIDFKVTDSVLEALILENNLIKKHLPHANTKEKDDKSFNHVIITKEKFPQVLLMRGKNIGTEIHQQFIKYDFGPYPQSSQLKEALKIVRKIFPFRDARCKVGQGRPCFNRQIGLCPGVCTGEITEREYARTIQHIKLFFEGKKTALIRSLEKEMAGFANKQEFEKANKIKKTLFALSHIQDVALIKEDIVSSENSFRIEAYDVAHLSGTNMTGAMVVVENGVLNKNEYRKFKIKSFDKANDVGALKEILTRRFAHPEWPMPNMLVVDGNEVQRKVAEETLFEIFKKTLAIDIVSVVKNEQHKPRAITGRAEVVDKYQKEILLANNEAHRFVIAYHKKLRSDFLK